MAPTLKKLSYLTPKGLSLSGDAPHYMVIYMSEEKKKEEVEPKEEEKPEEEEKREEPAKERPAEKKPWWKFW